MPGRDSVSEPRRVGVATGPTANDRNRARRSLLNVAQEELDTAVEYYNIESPSLGDQFLLEALLASVALI